MSKILRFLGFVWASPLTLIGLCYVVICRLFGWYKWIGVRGDVLVWQLAPETSPAWMHAKWEGWGGHCIGNVIVVKHDLESERGKPIFRHEEEHVRQCMILGIFQPFVYYVAYLALKTCRHSHPYHDNPFEIDARRAAGQEIDVVGTLLRRSK